MALTLYGMSKSRALRSIWAAEEIGIDYEHVPTSFAGESKAPEYLALNPNGRVPTLVDGDLVLFESMAINLYLAKKYGGALYPDNPADEARAIQWSIWGLSEIEPLQMELVVNVLMRSKEDQDQAAMQGAAKALQRPLKVLDGVLADRPYLLGDTFSIADLNLAAVMALLAMVKHDYSEHSNVKRWADACYGRPSYAAARAKD